MNFDSLRQLFLAGH